VLFLRPENFPVQSVTSLTLTTPGTVITLDPTQAFLDAGEQLVKFFQLIPLGAANQGNPYQTALTPRTVGTITLGYTAGFAYSALPPKIKKACVALLFRSAVKTAQQHGRDRHDERACALQDGATLAISRARATWSNRRGGSSPPLFRRCFR